MEKRPLVSVLMPVYNGQDYLRPAIDSVLNQSFSDFELIIVNDGSKDNSRTIVESYQDPRIVLINQENQGVARSLNNGLKQARGKYVRRHDADDISTTDSLKIQIDFLEKNPDYVMVCNQQAYMTSHGKIAWKYRMPNKKYFNEAPQKDLSFDDFRTDQASPVVHGTACYRLKDVLDLGGYRTAFIVSEDNDLWLRLLEKNKIAVLNKCTYFMRIHPGSATHRHAAKIGYFRQILIDYSLERRTAGSDPIMRGEQVPLPVFEEKSASPEIKYPRGKHFREDLRYMYSLVTNAGDYALMKDLFVEILHDGWKDSRTWKLLLFPILGDPAVQFGVKIKKLFKK
jgi:glycosyltransferase involved in cell wall biosynthesis